MEEEVKASYDAEFDTLYLYRPGLKPKGAVEIGDFIVEFTSELQKAVAIEVLNATRVLSELQGRAITAEMLSNIVRARLRTIRKTDAVYVIYAITWRIRQREDALENAVTVPLMVRA